MSSTPERGSTGFGLPVVEKFAQISVSVAVDASRPSS